MRWPALFVLCLPSIVTAGEPSPPCPLWDGHESVADYAKKVNLPPTKTLDLGNGVKMELVLIPAGKFIMGTPEPTPVNEASFQKQIVIGQLAFAASAFALVIMLTVVVVRALRNRRRPQLSLALLLLVTIASGGCVLNGLHWRGSVRELVHARLEFAAAKIRFDTQPQYEKPAHVVTLTNAFYMGKFDVTQDQYRSVTGTNRSQSKGKDNPVENVSWYEAQEFCKKVAEQTQETLRLPTEAEWEFAARAGTTTAWYCGDAETDLDQVAWHANNSKVTTHPVGQKQPNGFGLYDMHGNVWQWCQDWHADDYYTKSPVIDPAGPAEGTRGNREVRGGCYLFDPESCRSASRFSFDPTNLRHHIGFRVAASAPRTP
jgi:formylglycine-generating enzyme required for sulfatase activity